MLCNFNVIAMKKLLLILFLLSQVVFDATSQSITPNFGYKGQHINTTITTSAGYLAIGSGPTGNQDIYLQQGATVIYADWNYTLFTFADSLWATFSIPLNAPTGLYDVHVKNYYWDPFNGWTYSDDPQYGAFTINGDAGTITGQIYFDANQDGIKDINEQGLANHRIVVNPGGNISLSDQNGNYGLAVDSATYNVSYLPAFSYSQTSSPVSYNVTVPPSQSNLDFGAFTAQVLYKQELLVFHDRMRCNSTGYTSVTLRNNGNDTAFGSISLLLSSNLGFISSSPAPDVNLGDTLIWYYNNIAPGQSFTVGNPYVYFGNPSAGQFVWYSVIDSLRDNSGNLLTMYADSFATVVRCSYDPNEKMVFPYRTAVGNPTPMDNQLSYTINFQNTGNDTAYDVSIYDTIDANMDLNTLEIIGSSDPVTTQYTPSGALRFSFNHIMLPDSTTDEPGSHGFVQYRINPLPNLPDPTVVTNTSYIVFDYNDPIVTNTTITTFTDQQLPNALFASGNPVVCANTCVSFNAAPQTGASYQWYFPGGSPASSPLPNPTVCYPNAGDYDVTLMVTNAAGVDTLYQPEYIHINPLPALTVAHVGDSLNATQGFASYEWYYNSNLIPGATDASYVVTQNGDYVVVATNSYGCQSSVNLLNVMVGISENELSSEEITIFPNPSSGSFKVAFKSFGNVEAKVDLLNAVGSVVNSFDVVTDKGSNTVEMDNVAAGVYTLRLSLGQKILHQKVIIRN